MEEGSRLRLRNAAGSFSKPAGVKYSYGTAGFRSDASVLSSTVFRVGVLTALRSLITGKVTGMVVTASHNKASDNGVKMVDPDGGMLVMRFEAYADAIANAEDPTEVVDEIIRNEHFHVNWHGKVMVARDTRPSGQSLLDAAIKGIESMKVSVVDMGILTTPQLHWMVRTTNKGVSPTNELAYYMALSESFRLLLELNPRKETVQMDTEIVVDGSNGVGAAKLLDLQMLIKNLILDVRNSGQGELNHLVGADYVQKEKVLPSSFSASADAGKRCVSIDGDGDRLVYFYVTTDGVFYLLDGDKILSLFAKFLKQQIEDLAENMPFGQSEHGNVKIGVVQTAYANGASTKYLKEVLGLNVILTPTGVKYLHEEAKNFDIGVYFEANGHGTILFNEDFLAFLAKESNRCEPSFCLSTADKRCRAMKRLLAVSEMVNQAVGDAISGLLMVEALLAYSGWSIQEWDTMYSDLPSRQLKVKVKDRSYITTTDAETRVARPSELQKAIDEEVAKYNHGRAFVRPSGTEDVVRVYAEAATQESANQLASAVAASVQQLAGGV